MTRTRTAPVVSVSALSLALSAGAAARIDGQWTNALGGNWNVGTNWSTSPAFPNAPADTATIDLVTGAAYTVTLNSAVGLAALTLNSADAILSHTANTLNMNGGTINITAGTYRLAGGTISNATISGPGFTTFGSSGTLSGVTLATDLSIINNYILNASGGLTINAGRTVSLNSVSGFTVLDLGAGNQTLGGGGEVVFNGTSSTTGFVRAFGGTLVVDAGTTIRSGTQGGNVGQNGPVINNGTISSRTNARTIIATAVTNNASGLLEATNGGTLTMAGTWSNAGTLEATSGGTLTLGGVWSNTGTLRSNNSTLNLGGSFNFASIAPARLDRAGGTVNITGTLTNTGNTLMLDAGTGSFNLNGGTIIGGTIATPGDLAALLTAGTTGTLSGVILDTDLSIINSYTLNASGGLTINAGKTVSLDSGGSFTVLDLGVGSSALGGGGEVVFNGTNGSTGYVRAFGGTLVIDAGTTIRSGTQGGNVGQSGPVVNNGTISSRTNARTIIATAVTNNATGVLEATNGGTLTLAGAWSNAGTFLLDSNPASALNLGGSFGTSSVAPARFNRAGGTVNITGTLTNTGNTLTLDADTGSFNLNGGTITGGTIATSGGAVLNTTSSTSTLAGGVTLDTDLSLVSGANINVSGGLIVNAGRTVSLNSTGFAILDFLGAGNQNLAGGGDVVFDGTSSTTGFVRANSGTLVVGAGTTIRSGTQGGNVGQLGLIINNGTIAARTNARTVTARAVTNNATGVLEATNGGALTLLDAWSNAGTFLLDSDPASALNLGGSFNTAAVAPARWSRTGGTVNITGALANTGSNLTLDAATGSFNLLGGTITGGTIATSGGAVLNTTNSTSTLSGVTLDTSLTLVNGANINVSGGLTVNAGRTVSLNSGAGFTILDFLGAGNQNLAGGGDVVFDGTSSTTGFVRANSGTLVVGAGTTVRSGAQGGNVGQTGLIINNGTIAARTNSRTITARAVTNNATGVLEATNGGTLTLIDAWSNAGTFLLNGSTLNLGGTFNSASVAPARWSRTGGTVNITGTLTNTGNTLTLDGATGSFVLQNGTIAGGTISGSAGSTLLTSSAGVGGALTGGVTLDTDVSLLNNYTLSVGGGLTINAGKTVSIIAGANATVLDLLGAGNQTLTGAGEVVFDGTNNTNGFVRANAGTLVIDTGITVRSGVQGGNLGQLGALVNKGVVSSQTAAKTITLTGTTLANEGTMIAANGGTLSFARAGGLSSNTGADLLARTGGTLRFNSGMNVANNGGFDLEVASASQTLGYGRIAITGNAAISGTDIDLIFTGGFTPDWGDTFHILSFTTLTGDMSTLALPSLTDPMLRWWREQTTSAYRVGVRHIADNNHDGVVDFLDLNRVLGTFGQAGMSLQGDGNEDGVVDFFDLNDVLSLFGQSAPPNPIPAPGALALFAGAAALGASRRRR